MNSFVSILRVLQETRKLILTAFVCLFVAFSMTAADESAAMKDVVQSEQASRKAVVDDVSKLMDEAQSFMVQNKFFEASRKCVAARAKLDNLSGPYAELKRQKLNEFNETLKRRWASALMVDARMAIREKRYDEAISMAKSLSKINPDQEAAAKNLIDMAGRFKKSDDFKDKTALVALDPDNSERKEDVNVLIQEARVLYKNKEYDKARVSIERALLKDPYNVDATFLLDKLYRREFSVGNQRRENEILERMYEVEWKWNEAVLPTEAIKPKGEGPKEAEGSKVGIFDKLNKIVFDQIDFDEASITSVITHLKQRSKQLDPDGVGVSLILRLSEEMAKSDPRVTMSFDQIPMSEVLRYLCQGTGLKYRVEEQAVLIGDADIDEMETKFFKVRAELISNIITGGSGGKDDGGDTADTAVASVDITAVDTTSTKPAAAATSDALKKYFMDRGVPFSEGSTVAYERRSGKLIVKNSLENLRKLEFLLRELDIQKPMVLIEAKFLEIQQTDLEELGFDWIFSGQGVGYSYESDSPAQQAFGINETNKLVRNVAGTNLNNTDRAANAQDRVINNLALIPNSGGDNQFNLYVSVYALDRSGRVDTLSSPKVIASSGTTATIRMVREYYFPESWNEPEISITNSAISYTPAYPAFGETTDVGIRFEVTPTVFSNNYTIMLELNPQVIAFVQWTEYPIDVVVGGVEIVPPQVIRMPELSKRDLVAKIKVFDGETVVLGGMLTSTNSSRQDKYPGLGDIPIAGRLFQSIMDRKIKTNLMIFMTCRLMNNDGVPVRRNVLRGLPEFNR
ncbi:MAG: hypothetical protein A2020_15725 [Lentisphaerae bacterium GWF2_45_14]|nr:MAG: hypothetical protein A2020_15725 [Lentisphaerae bacterium GWF2_45_14]